MGCRRAGRRVFGGCSAVCRGALGWPGERGSGDRREEIDACVICMVLRCSRRASWMAASPAVDVSSTRTARAKRGLTTCMAKAIRLPSSPPPCPRPSSRNMLACMHACAADARPGAHVKTASTHLSAPSTHGPARKSFAPKRPKRPGARPSRKLLRRERRELARAA
jgi:hypothetical protein